MIQKCMAHLLTYFGTTAELTFASAVMLAFLFVADVLIEQRPFEMRTFWALFDVLVHGILALFVTSPLFDAYENTKRTALFFCIIFLVATLIDLDHFIAAGSLDLSDALSLDVRPPTHSLTFAGTAGLLSFLISRSPIIGWGVFVALSSHVVRDASSGITPILWPLPFRAIPWWAYYLGEVGLFISSYLLMNRGLLARSGGS